MNNLLEQVPISYPPVSKLKPRSVSIFSLFIWMIVFLAFIAGFLVLMNDLFGALLPQPPLSAAPLLLIGAAYLGFQALARPKPLNLFKAFLVSSAFLLWGIDLLLPLGWLATTLGDVVIVLYVLDLGWTILDHLKQRKVP